MAESRLELHLLEYEEVFVYFVIDCTRTDFALYSGLNKAIKIGTKYKIYHLY